MEQDNDIQTRIKQACQWGIQALKEEAEAIKAKLLEVKAEVTLD